MEKNLLFSFDDEITTGFYYDIDGHKIVVYLRLIMIMGGS